MTRSRTGSDAPGRPAPAVALATAVALVGLLGGGLGGAVATGTSGDHATVLTWSQSGLTDPPSVELDAFEGHPVSLLVPSEAIAARRALTIQLACRDRLSGEEGSVALSALGQAASAGRVNLTVATVNAVPALPYPIDPLAVGSKPAAIIAQREGRSVIGLDRARLRDLYRDVEAYMLTTANHHYPLPTGDGILDCRFEVRDGAKVLPSSRFEIVIGRGAPGGTYPRDHDRIPLAARTWWVADPASLPQDVRDAIVASDAAPRGDTLPDRNLGRGSESGACRDAPMG